MRWRTLWVLTLLLLSGCKSGEQIEPPISERDFLTVKTERVVSESSGSKLSEFSGRLRASQKTQIAFLRSGRLEQVYVDEGAQVTQGETLARLDTRSLLARQQELKALLAEAQAAAAEIEAPPRTFERAAAENQVKEIESQLTLVRTKLERRRLLFQEGAIAREQVDELLSQEMSLVNQLRGAQNRVRDLDAGALPQTRRGGRARIQNVRASLDSLQVELADSVLKAPYSGTITKRFLDRGTIVNAGEAVFELLGNEALEAELFLPPGKVEKLRIGESLDLVSEGKTYSGKVTRFLPMVNTESGTQPVLLKMSPSAELKAGQLVRLRLGSEQVKEGYWVPSTALLPGERGLFVCFTLSPVEGQPELFEVKKQAIEIITTDGERTFVRGTLVEQADVIVEGVHRVVPGQKVRRA